jgi:pimeloyl-ACP methyl ester carboxylesterase
LPDQAAVAVCEELDLRLGEPDADDADALASLALLWPGYFADPAQAPPLPEDTRLSLACAAGTFASVMPALSDGLFARRLPELAAPVVVLVGEASPLPRALGEQTAALLPHAELTVVPGAGHLPWFEEPGCVARALTRAASLAQDRA